MSRIPKMLGQIQKLRETRGMTREELAERSGLSVEILAQLEDGVGSPTLDTINKLCVGFDLQPSELLEALEQAD